MCRSDSERAWLFHEIGYCHLSKREFSRAKQFGEMSYAAAERSSDLIWQLNASTLIAQSEARMGDLQHALETFKYALDVSKLIGTKPQLPVAFIVFLCIASFKQHYFTQSTEQNRR